MKRRKRNYLGRAEEPWTPEMLAIHRELQYLRVAGLMRRRKPSRRKHAYGKVQQRDFGWIKGRWRKLQEVRQPPHS